MNRISQITLCMLLGITSAFATPPRIPTTNEVVRYERFYPVFQSKAISKKQGDALLSALDGGRQILEKENQHGAGIGAYYKVGDQVICALPVPPHVWLNITLTNGSVYRIGVGDGFVTVPDGYNEVTDVARERIAKVVGLLDKDLKQEIVNAPRPLVYSVGTVEDGGTLSGIARLFYGDATKWQMIYETNRSAIKNPNSISGGMKLTIPKLQ